MIVKCCLQCVAFELIRVDLSDLAALAIDTHQTFWQFPEIVPP